MAGKHRTVQWRECKALLIWEGKVSKMNDCTHPVRLVELECQQQKISCKPGKSTNFAENYRLFNHCIHMFSVQA
jgi:hypothetical protein